MRVCGSAGLRVCIQNMHLQLGRDLGGGRWEVSGSAGWSFQGLDWLAHDVSRKSISLPRSIGLVLRTEGLDQPLSSRLEPRPWKHLVSPPCYDDLQSLLASWELMADAVANQHEKHPLLNCFTASSPARQISSLCHFLMLAGIAALCRVPRPVPKRFNHPLSITLGPARRESRSAAWGT